MEDVRSALIINHWLIPDYDVSWCHVQIQGHIGQVKQCVKCVQGIQELQVLLLIVYLNNVHHMRIFRLMELVRKRVCLIKCGQICLIDSYFIYLSIIILELNILIYLISIFLIEILCVFNYINKFKVNYNKILVFIIIKLFF